jgi:hypothetical protein
MYNGIKSKNAKPSSQSVRAPRVGGAAPGGRPDDMGLNDGVLNVFPRMRVCSWEMGERAQWNLRAHTTSEGKPDPLPT